MKNLFFLLILSATLLSCQYQDPRYQLPYDEIQAIIATGDRNPDTISFTPEVVSFTRIDTSSIDKGSECYKKGAISANFTICFEASLFEGKLGIDVCQDVFGMDCSSSSDSGKNLVKTYYEIQELPAEEFYVNGVLYANEKEGYFFARRIDIIPQKEGNKIIRPKETLYRVAGWPNAPNVTKK